MKQWFVRLWVAPVTAIGLVLAVLGRASGGTMHRAGDGVVECYGGVLAWLLSRGLPFSGPVAAMTIGHVVVAQSAEALAATRAHERVHVGQFERWGVFFLAAYPIAGLAARLTGGHPYRDNRFEREARRAEANAALSQSG